MGFRGQQTSCWDLCSPQAGRLGGREAGRQVWAGGTKAAGVGVPTSHLLPPLEQRVPPVLYLPSLHTPTSGPAREPKLASWPHKRLQWHWAEAAPGSICQAGICRKRVPQCHGLSQDLAASRNIRHGAPAKRRSPPASAFSPGGTGQKHQQGEGAWVQGPPVELRHTAGVNKVLSLFKVNRAG